jgi:hypothetical protein
MFRADLNSLNRYQAFGIHLALSFAIFVVLAALIVFVWYPDFFFSTDGGWSGMRIIVAVDLVLGPVLTLVVFKAGKPGLKMDLTLIGLFQAICLAGGTYVVYAERPIAIVYALGEFYVTSADDYLDIGKPVPRLDDVPSRLKWVALQLPDNAEASAAVRQEYLKKGESLYAAAEHYVPFNASDPGFIASSEDLAVIQEKDERLNLIAPFLAKHGGDLNDYRFYPFATRYQYTYLAFDRTNRFVGLLDTPAF